MKLGLMAYQMAKPWDLDTTIEMCVAGGMASFEFFPENGYGQGVELDMPADKRAEVKEKFAKSGVAIAGIAIVDRYDSPDERKLRETIEHSKQYVQLARDLGAPRLRCLGDQLHEDVEPKEKTIARVAKALRELCEYADEFDVDCALEMHGKFSDWQVSLPTVQQVDHPRCYLIHNGQPANTPPERFDEVFAQIRPHLGHCHFHDLTDERFPYRRFCRALAGSGYEGRISLELRPSEDPVRVLQLTRALFDAYLE